MVEWIVENVAWILLWNWKWEWEYFASETQMTQYIVIEGIEYMMWDVANIVPMSILVIPIPTVL